MSEINLIFTRHKESGLCNSAILYNLIAQIKPEVIFEELSFSHFNESYVQSSLITLETNAIKLYLRQNMVRQIPVDTYQLPINYYKDLDKMYDKLFHSTANYGSFNLRSLVDDQQIFISQYGFRFLNSQENVEYFTEFESLKEEILKNLNNINLSRIHQLEIETIRKREDQIIENIYNFSKNNSYKTGLMFIGSGHAYSIIKVIQEFNIEDFKINWKGYDNQSLF